MQAKQWGSHSNKPMKDKPRLSSKLSIYINILHENRVSQSSFNLNIVNNTCNKHMNKL
ncbi:hypothetical protein [Clostridium botulinum]|uniref:hypothetical protein n=1 Tax=Clostridium botulinum TaxID=1491 RepID=UPI003DA32214